MNAINDILLTPAKTDIISRLKRDIIAFQGCRSTVNSIVVNENLGPIKYAFPNSSFPLGAVHEFICSGPENTAATHGFIAGILAALVRKQGVIVVVGSSQNIFPPALKTFGIEPDKIIFIDAKNEKEKTWVIEEALKCDGLAAVIGILRELSFLTSRRLQIAVEQSRVTGFIIRQDLRNLNPTACVTRWKITSLPSYFEDDMPGIGFPRWNVELLKVRNGKPGEWQVEWINGRFRYLHKPISMPAGLQRKTG